MMTARLAPSGLAASGYARLVRRILALGQILGLLGQAENIDGVDLARNLVGHDRGQRGFWRGLRRRYSRPDPAGQGSARAPICGALGAHSPMRRGRSAQAGRSSYECGRMAASGAPYGTRTRVTAVKGRCPGQLDE